MRHRSSYKSAFRRDLALLLVASSLLGTAVATMRAITPDVLSFLFSVGTLGSGSTDFAYPLGIAIGGPANRIYVADTQRMMDPVIENDRISVFEADGTPAFSFGGSGSADGRLTYPVGIAVDASGKILVADSDNNRLQLFAADGAWLQTFGSFGNFDPLDPANRDGSGNYIGPAPTLDRFYWPSRVALRPGTRLGDPTDSAGRVAVVDNGNHRIVLLSATLTPLGAFGSFGTNGNALGEFEYPIGVGMDLQNIYVADPQNHRIQVFDQQGTGLRFFGSRGAENSPGDLQEPFDAQPDGQGRLLVTDTDRGRVLIMVPDPAAPAAPLCSETAESLAAGRCTVIASDGARYDARLLGTDGNGPGEFMFPQAVAADANGRVVVLDTDNHRFQVFQGAGLHVTSATVSPAGPVQSGQNVIVSVVVLNDGAAALTVTPSAVPNRAGQLTAPAPAAVAAGSSHAFTFTFVTNENGLLHFDASATGLTGTGAAVHDGQVSTADVLVTPATGPKLMAMITASPAQVGPGGTITVQVKLKNSGSVPLDNVTSSLSISPSGLLSPLTTPPADPAPLAVNTSRTFTYTFAGSTTSFGTVTFRAGGSGSYADASLPGGTGSIVLDGSKGPSTTAKVVSDAQAPVSALTMTGTPGAAGWYTSSVHVVINATDAVGVAAINYHVDGLLGFSRRVPGDTAAFDITFEGGADIAYWAEDAAGNLEARRAVHVNIDSMAPVISRGGVAPAPNWAGWIRAFPTVSFIASDGGSGIASVTPSQVVGTDGAGQVVHGTTIDLAGNTAAVDVTVNVDTRAPTVVCAPTAAPNAFGWFTGAAPVTVNCVAADQAGLSGLSAVRAICPDTIGAPPVAPGAPAAIAACTIATEGDHVVIGEASDVAGNRSATSIRVRIDHTPPVVVCGTASGGEIWPPNHKMIAWDTFVTVRDAISGGAGFTLVAYSSSEAANALGDGNTGLDMAGWTLGAPDTSGVVRSERSGPGTGRLYRLRYVGFDAAGHTTSCITVVTQVPHDRGKN